MSSRFYFNSLKTNSKIAFQFLPVIILMISLNLAPTISLQILALSLISEQYL